MAPLDLDTMGPVDHLVVEFAAGLPCDGAPFRQLGRLVQADTIRLLGLQLVRCEPDGELVPLPLDAVAPAPSVHGPLVALLDQAATGALRQRDLVAAGAGITPGCDGVVVVFENRWASALAIGLRRSGALLVDDSRLHIQAFLASLAH